ncbi:hypothetical protein IBA8401_12000 [Pseudomonas syringae]
MASKVVKVIVYTWEGVDKKGTKTSGELSGHNLALVKAQLRKQGINPTKVRKKSASIFGKGKKIKPLDIAFFFSADGNDDEGWRTIAAVVRHNQRGCREPEHANIGKLSEAGSFSR